jgi:hypothetical protein
MQEKLKEKVSGDSEKENATRLEFLENDRLLKKKTGLSWISLVRLGLNSFENRKEENFRLKELETENRKLHERIGSLLRMMNEMQNAIYDQDKARIAAEKQASEALAILRGSENKKLDAELKQKVEAIQ